MPERKKIFGICGSASQDSANLSILKFLAERGAGNFELEIFNDLHELPHFRTELTDENVPDKIVWLRNMISKADGIIICTPEYVFSIPSGLKNAIEWCVSTTVFSQKPIGLITASSSGTKGHQELKLIMETVQAIFVDETTLLIQGVKSKIKQGKVSDQKAEVELIAFLRSFMSLLEQSSRPSINS